MGYRDYSTAKGHIVDATGHGDFTTIASALAAASSGQTVFVRDGTYTENLTMVPGVRLTAFVAPNSVSTVTIIGKMTFTATGSYEISNINLQTNSDFIVSCTGSNNCNPNFTNCSLIGTNNTIIQLTNSNASSSVNFDHCTMDLTTTGISYFSHSGAGSIVMFFVTTSNSGNSTTATTHSGGNFTANHSAILAPYANSGTTATFNTNYSIFNCDVINTTPVTINSTTATLYPACNCNFRGGSASALSIGAGAALSVLNSCFNSSNTNAITGSGTINYAGLSFENSAGTNITTKSQLKFLPKVSPTVQSFTSGSAATYTTPANCQWIRIRCIGGGGGGSGSGTSPGATGNGTATTFSGGTLSAGGGVGGDGGGGGGTSSGGNIALPGMPGNPRPNNSTGQYGGNGGSGPFGGGGPGGNNSPTAGIAAGANSGGGGGGAGNNTTGFAGGGGGSGGYCEHIINGPAATYTYTVGAGGAGGTAGTSGAAGGAGAAGLIIVEEYYL